MLWKNLHFTTAGHICTFDWAYTMLKGDFLLELNKFSDCQNFQIFVTVFSYAYVSSKLRHDAY